MRLSFGYRAGEQQIGIEIEGVKQILLGPIHPVSGIHLLGFPFGQLTFRTHDIETGAHACFRAGFAERKLTSGFYEACLGILSLDARRQEFVVAPRRFGQLFLLGAIETQQSFFRATARRQRSKNILATGIDHPDGLQLGYGLRLSNGNRLIAKQLNNPTKPCGRVSTPDIGQHSR